MKVTIRFFGIFRSISGKRKLTLEFERTVSLKEVINKIVEVMPKLQKSLGISESGGPRSDTLIIVNGKEVGVLDGLETEIKDEDKIVLVPVTHGG